MNEEEGNPFARGYAAVVSAVCYAIALVTYTQGDATYFVGPAFLATVGTAYALLVIFGSRRACEIACVITLFT